MLDTLVATKPVIAAVALGVLWLLEAAVPMFEGRKNRVRHGAANLGLGLANAAVAAILLAGVALLVTEVAHSRSIGLLHWLQLDGIWGTVLALVLFDLWQYLWHRMNHRISFLWRFHAVHHADRDLDASSGLRFHTGEIILSSLARLLVLPLLGMTVGQLLIYEAILLPVILFHHSNVRIPARFDFFLRWLIVTPWMHWVHHSQHQPETDSNYSSVLSLWDRIFGSYRRIADPTTLALGLAGTDRRDWGTLPGMLAMPFRGGSAEGRESGSAEGRARSGEQAQTKPEVRPKVRMARAFAPASVSNVACGFDVFGFAVEGPGDEVTARLTQGRGIVQVEVGGDGGRIPTTPSRNTAAVAAAAVLKRLDSDAGVTLTVRKGLPLASGLGGSAASAVAGAVATDALLRGGLDITALLECALEGEERGSGAFHTDNAAPALAGGFVLMPPGRPLRIVKLPTPPELTAAVVHPHVEVETAKAREMLSDNVPLAAGIRHWGNTAGLVAGLYESDWELIARCLHDEVGEPVRKVLIPGYDDVRERALAAGALGVGLSGSGPSVFALCRGRTTAEEVAVAMSQTFQEVSGLVSDTLVSAVGTKGAQLLEVR